jgi:hypothetical protein
MIHVIPPYEEHLEIILGLQGSKIRWVGSQSAKNEKLSTRYPYFSENFLCLLLSFVTTYGTAVYSDEIGAPFDIFQLFRP